MFNRAKPQIHGDEVTKSDLYAKLQKIEERIKEIKSSMRYLNKDKSSITKFSLLSDNPESILDDKKKDLEFWKAQRDELQSSIAEQKKNRLG